MIAWREDSGWLESEQSVYFTVFRQAIPISVWTGHEALAHPGAPTPAHLAAINGLLAVPPERRDEWSARVFADFCQAIESGECELRSEDTPNCCPTAEDVWPLIEWRDVVVPDQGREEIGSFSFTGAPTGGSSTGSNCCSRTSNCCGADGQTKRSSSRAPGRMTTCRGTAPEPGLPEATLGLFAYDFELCPTAGRKG